MPRGADRLLSHLANPSVESAPPSDGHRRSFRRQPSSAVYIYRHPLGATRAPEEGGSPATTPAGWSSLTRELENATGSHLRPVGSIIRRSPMSVRLGRSLARRTTLPSNPPSPPLDPTLENPEQQFPARSSVPAISVSSDKSPPERQISSYMDTKSTTATAADELMQILMEDDGTDRPMLFTVFEAANIDGVKHLSSKSRCTRYTWFLLIILFICLCFYQIGAQAMMYWLTPVATNIIAVYPESIAFPVVAICNNNQHRLTWLTGPRLQQGRGTHQHGKRGQSPPDAFRKLLNQTDVFDRALLNTWDMDAGEFLRSASHQKARMIVRCELPNGSRCSPRDFRPVWTLTGLCWAINTDPAWPMHVTGAGPGNALRLLVNIERYERVESCTPKLRTRSLPGLKVLIYNQTDTPAHYLEGVNVPAGFTMDIPFWMRHRQKLPGKDCVVIDDSSSVNGNGSSNNGGRGGNGSSSPEERNSIEDLRSCQMRSYLGEIERRCNCSMRQAYLQLIDEHSKRLPQCNVFQYFECVQPVLEWARNQGFINFRHCPIPCESIDYTAWQDMTELPANIFPKLISEGRAEDDEEESEEKDSSEESNSASQMRSDENFLDSNEQNEHVSIAGIWDNLPLVQEHYQCVHNQLLSDQHVRKIKKAAQLAFEKQARHQEDIQLRTKRLIAQIRQSVHRIIEMRWGWKSEHFLGVHQRLRLTVSCYEEVPKRHPDVFNAMANPKPQGEEDRAQQLLQLLGVAPRTRLALKSFKTIEDVKRMYGERAEEKRKEMQLMEELARQMHSLFSEETFTERLPKSLERTMDKIMQLMALYEKGLLPRKNWAERMQARNMRHFFDEDFYESWYNLIVKDLEHGVLNTIQQIEETLPALHRDAASNGTAILTGSVVLFGDPQAQHQEMWAAFMDDALECTFNDIRNASLQMLREFQRAMYDLQSTQIALFRKELPDYLQNFDFGRKFVQENFAQVNVFLHKMHIEHWRQEPTYSIWSFFCDIGATMSLFLGASMLTIIEVLYFVIRNTRIYKSIEVWRQRKFSDDRKTSAGQECQKGSNGPQSV